MNASSIPRRGKKRAEYMRTIRRLKRAILHDMKSQGFDFAAQSESFPAPEKEAIRKLHSMAVKHKLDKSQPGLERHEQSLLRYIANGTEVVPNKIDPILKLVEPETEEELLFRWTRLHWSIPTSPGYGRRLRFLVIDQANGKLMGLIGLGDPVFGLGPRDKWIGWDLHHQRAMLRHVMDAFVLGAIPPYNSLLCGKLIAALATSSEVRAAFRQKYRNSEAVLTQKPFDGRLALVTTTSALGRSSVYNRLKNDGRLLYTTVGFTSGSGDFQFMNGTYDQIFDFATKYCDPTAKQTAWGTGFRNRREVVRKSLSHLNLDQRLLYHGVKREIFVAPLAYNTAAFMRGDHQRLLWISHDVRSIVAEFRDR